MCGSMVDIHSATAEIRRREKEEEETTVQKYNVRICYAGGHKKDRAEAKHNGHRSTLCRCTFSVTFVPKIIKIDSRMLEL